MKDHNFSHLSAQLSLDKNKYLKSNSILLHFSYSFLIKEHKQKFKNSQITVEQR